MIGLYITYLVTAVGCLGGLVRPAVGVVAYFWLALMRPEFFWFWSFTGESRSLSKYVAAFTILGWAVASGPANLMKLRAIKWPVLGFAMFLFVGYLLSKYVALSEASALLNLELQWKIGLMALIAITSINTRKDIMLLMGTLVFCLGYMAFELNMEWRSSYRISSYRLNMHGDNNNLSLLMVSAMPICLFTALVTRQVFLKVLCGGFALLALHAVLFLESRGAYLAMVLVFLLMFIFALARLPRKGLTVAATVVMLAAGLWLAGDRVQKEWHSIFVAAEERDGSASQRTQLALAGWDMYKRNPIGLGPRQSGYKMPEYGLPRGKLIHNLYLQIAADYGTFGFIGYFMFLFGSSLLIAALAFTRHREDDLWMQYLASGMAIGMVGFLGAGVFLSCERIEIGIIVATAGLCLVRYRYNLIETSVALPTEKLPELADVPPPGAVIISRGAISQTDLSHADADAFDHSLAGQAFAHQGAESGFDAFDNNGGGAITPFR